MDTKQTPRVGGGEADDDNRDGLVWMILVLLAFLAVALLFFGSGWIRVAV